MDAPQKKPSLNTQPTVFRTMKIFTHTHLIFLFTSATLTNATHAGDPATDVWPKPQQIVSQEKSKFPATRLDPSSVAKFPALVAVYQTINQRPTGKVPIKTATGDAAKSVLSKAQVKPVPGAYLLDITSQRIGIAATDSTGIFYATQTLAQLIVSDGKVPHCKIADWPDTAFRGSIEGFYGKPWEHERRLSQIRFYGKYKMNAYIYGPKDDPYSGFNSHKWRDEYPAEQAKQITELVKVSQDNHVNFIWALHPGSSIRWDDHNGDGTPDDIVAALKKLEAMYQLGVRSFAIFFDDIGGEGAKAEMQAKMLNQINRDFIKKKKDVTPLLMCPTSYSGSGADGYKMSLGAALDKDIDIMWTGPRICSDIPADATKEVSKHWQRKPFIWWNWPVNDYCRYNLLLGRTYGLDKGNLGLLSGFASNPMDKPEASKIGLFSIANWSWNINAFDSQKSWEASFPRLYPTLSEPMFLFAKHNSDQGKNFHGYRREESVEIKPVVDKALEDYRQFKKIGQAEADILTKEFEAIRQAAEKISDTLPSSDPALWHEIEYWVKSFGELGKAGKAAVTMASGKGGDAKSHMALFSTIVTARSRQQEFSNAQKQRHFEETFASDKKWAKGCKVATLVLTPCVETLFSAEWAKAYTLLGGKSATANTAYQAFSNVPELKHIEAERDGKFVSLRRILEVVKLAPKKHIGLALPAGIHANYIHIKLDNAKAAEACTVEVSPDGKTWESFSTRKGNGELQNPVNLNEKIRYFRMSNHSSQTIEFRIEKFKFDIPANAKGNSLAASADGDPTSFYTISKPETLTGPAEAKKAYLLSDAPEEAIQRNGNKITITPPKGGKVHLFEIIWK